MKRRNFIFTTALSLPEIAFANKMKQTAKSLQKGFVIKSDKTGLKKTQK